jgi:hypothetical protein
MKHINNNFQTEISFNDLSKYSAWPARLLSLEHFPTRQKSKKEVLREYQTEKWNDLYQAVIKTGNPTLEMVESLSENPDEISPYADRDRLFLSTNINILERHLELYHKVLEPHCKGAAALVELGAGYGSKILGLAKRQPFSDMRLVGAELTENGRNIMSLLNQSVENKIEVGSCDFDALTIDPKLVPKNSVIFTSYAAHYVPELSMDFAAFLLQLEPKAIIHFEPVYELFSTDSIYELMCRRYMEVNDYTRNLLSVINHSVDKKKSVISSLKINQLSANPFLPISVIEWHPNKKSS